MTLLYSKQQPDTDILPLVWVFVWLSFVCLLLSSDLGKSSRKAKVGNSVGFNQKPGQKQVRGTQRSPSPKRSFGSWINSSRPRWCRRYTQPTSGHLHIPPQRPYPPCPGRAGDTTGGAKPKPRSGEAKSTGDVGKAENRVECLTYKGELHVGR